MLLGSLTVTVLTSGRPLTAMATTANGISSTPPAAAAVFATTELLEHIFMSLKLVDLVYAERVSRQWYDVIAGSTILEVNRFLVPAPRDLYAVNDPAGDGRLKPVSISESSEGQLVVDLHPALTDTSRGWTYRLRDAARWETGRGREMFVTQPPCKRATIMYFRSEAMLEGTHDIANAAGLRLADLPISIATTSDIEVAVRVPQVVASSDWQVVEMLSGSPVSTSVRW